MKHSFKTGISFGLTSGIITTLGLMVGLNSGTHSKTIVLGGILTIAVADSLSDALGIHLSEESKHNPKKEIWESTISTFLSKLSFALTFLIPILLFNLKTAMIVSIIWGLFALSTLTYYISKRQKSKNILKAILEHLIIAVIVIIATHFIGGWIATVFR